MNFFTGSTIKQHKESLLKFFKLIDENPPSENATLDITNRSGKCGLLTKKLCVQKHNSNSSTVKKSFRPYYYDDDDDDEDSDDYDETPDDDDFPEETERGSYRSYAPRNHGRPFHDESEDYESESWRGQNFDDEDSEPGYEGDMDDWDWDSPRRHRERHFFKGAGNIDQPNDFAPTVKRITKHFPWFCIFCLFEFIPKTRMTCLTLHQEKLVCIAFFTLASLTYSVPTHTIVSMLSCSSYHRQHARVGPCC